MLQDTVFGEVYSGNRQPFSPAEFLFQWWRYADSLAGYQQQDAHEFYLSLLEGLSGSLITPQQDPPLQPAATAAAAAGITQATHQSAGPVAGGSHTQLHPSQQPNAGHMSTPSKQQQQQQSPAVFVAQSVTNHTPGVATASSTVLESCAAAPGSHMPFAAGVLEQVTLPSRPDITPPTGPQHIQAVSQAQHNQHQHQQQQQVCMHGSNADGWVLEQQQQQQSGPTGGELSGYDTPMSSGASPEPEGDTEGGYTQRSHCSHCCGGVMYHVSGGCMCV